MGYYKDYSQFLAEHFPGVKMQKLAVNAGFTCPNRDGSKGVGGCIYCNNHSFNPAYCSSAPTVTKQLEDGKVFFARKYPTMRYLAYFQAYTNTYADIDRLMALYREALAVDGVDGLIIGTRPDCMPQELLEGLKTLNTKIFIEYGAESSHDATLNVINRCHTWADTVDAVKRAAEGGFPVGLHFILGLPGEDEQMILQTIDRAVELPISAIKLHQLQVLKGTRLSVEVASGRIEVPQYTVDEYIDLCVKIVQRIPQTIAIERFVSQSPDDLLISPRWGLKNYQFTNLLNNKLRATLGAVDA